MSLRSPDRSSIEQRRFYYDTVVNLNNSLQYTDVFCTDPAAIHPQFDGAPPTAAPVQTCQGPLIEWVFFCTSFGVGAAGEIALECSNNVAFTNVFQMWQIAIGGTGPFSSGLAHTVLTGGGAVTTVPFTRAPMPFWRIRVEETAGQPISGRLAAAGGGW